MNRIVIDAELAAKIYQLKGPSQLVDAAGRVVADVAPRVDPAEYARVGNLEDEFTPEEIEQMLAPDQKCYTTEEVLARLRSL